jgi:hypothetical protein
MPRPPPIHDKEYVCTQCNRKFKSKAGRTRHIFAKHAGSHDIQMESPQSDETDYSSDISSCLGHPSPTHLSHTPDSPSRNSDAINFSVGGENDFDFNNGNIDDTSPPRDTASLSMEYHPYINGEMNLLD